MTARERLVAYRNQVLLLAAMEQDLSRIGASGAPARIQPLRCGDGRFTNEPAAATAQAWEGLMKRRDALARALSEELAAALDIIRTATDSRTYMLLTLYYLQGLTDQQIAKTLYISREQVNKRRNAFFRQLH